jgi:hypothetical protein
MPQNLVVNPVAWVVTSTEKQCKWHDTKMTELITHGRRKDYFLNTFQLHVCMCACMCNVQWEMRFALWTGPW